MAEHTYTVRVRATIGNKGPREFNCIRANSGKGAIARVVDMFHVNESDCSFSEEA